VEGSGNASLPDDTGELCNELLVKSNYIYIMRYDSVYVSKEGFSLLIKKTQTYNVYHLYLIIN